VASRQSPWSVLLLSDAVNVPDVAWLGTRLVGAAVVADFVVDVELQSGSTRCGPM
jgi:hypothetical protein